MKTDYHTAGGGIHHTGKGYGVPNPGGKGHRTVISNRFYLSDADFLVGLEGDPDLLQRLNAALARPRWQLFLGRKAFTPGAPIRLPDNPPWGPGVRDGELEEELRSYPWLGYQQERRFDDVPKSLRLVLDATPNSGIEVRLDVPISFADRRFISRYVRTDWVKLADLEALCTSPN